MEKFPRLLRAAYDDGNGRFKIKDRIETTLKGQTRKVLIPNARRLSRVLHYNRRFSEEESETSSHLLMQMGQFLDHDLSLAPELEFDCCNETIGKNESLCATVNVLQQKRL